MFNFIKKYTEKISQPFLKMFPESLHDDVRIVTNLLPADTYLLHKDKPAIVIVDTHEIYIYSRIYKPELEESKISNLTQTQKLILSCIYTRHHDGFIREKYVKNILADQRSWTIPFTVKLLGEYVVEMIILIKQSLVDSDSKELYKDFIAHNPIFWEITKARIVSYWNTYYRNSFVDKETYPGVEVIKILEGN